MKTMCLPTLTPILIAAVCAVGMAADNSDSNAQQLPSSLNGFVKDWDDSAIASANVTFRIYRAKFLFSNNESDTNEKWVSTTNDQGEYRIPLENVKIEPDDELELQIEADGYRTKRSTVHLKQVLSGKLPIWKLSLRVRAPAADETSDLWDRWNDDTESFKAQVAATVNGAPILNGQVIDRYSGYLIELRKAMRARAREMRHVEITDAPKDYEKMREDLVRQELPGHIRKKVFSQYLLATLSEEELATANLLIDESFEIELEKLKKELDASNLEELDAALRKRETSLKNVKDNFVLSQLFAECIASKVESAISISESEILDYYESHSAEFQRPRTVDWQQIRFHFSPGLHRVFLKNRLEQIVTRLNEGRPCDGELENLADQNGVSRNLWKATIIEDLASREMRDRMTSTPLDQWSLVIVEQSVSTASPVATGGNAASDFLTRLSQNEFGLPSNSTGSTEPVTLIKKPENSSSGPKFGLAKEEYVSKGPELNVICVTARCEPGYREIDEVREEIRKILAGQQNVKRIRRFNNKVLSSAKIESSYTLPRFIDDEPADNPEEVAEPITKP